MIRVPQLVEGALAVTLLLGLAIPVWAEEATGTIRTVHSDKNEVVVKGIVKDSTYRLNRDSWVTLDGRKSKLTDLQEGDRAHIFYEKGEGDKVIVNGVRVIRKASETSGTIKNVIADKNEIILKGVVKDSTYHIDKDATVWINNKERTLTDLREGDTVYLTYETRNEQYFVSEARCYRK